MTDNEKGEFSDGEMLLADDPREANVARSRAALDDSILRRLYSYMLKCRTVEERIRILFRQSRFSGNYFSAVGQEATEVGTTVDLLPEDTIAPSHRNFVTHIMKGTPLKHMFVNLFFMRRTSPDQGRRAPAHLGSAPLNVITPASTVAAQFAIGVGVALAYQLQKRSNVVVALSGEGSTSLESSDVTATASLDAALKETGDKGKAASSIG